MVVELSRPSSPHGVGDEALTEECLRRWKKPGVSLTQSLLLLNNYYYLIIIIDDHPQPPHSQKVAPRHSESIGFSETVIFPKESGGTKWACLLLGAAGRRSARFSALPKFMCFACRGLLFLRISTVCSILGGWPKSCFFVAGPPCRHAPTTVCSIFGAPKN